MKGHKLTKLSSEDLSSVYGGQIYKAWDEEEEAFCYLVPSATVYATYYNETEAKLKSRHLPRNNIVSCATLEEASYFAVSDCAYYQILNNYKN